MGAQWWTTFHCLKNEIYERLGIRYALLWLIQPLGLMNNALLYSDQISAIKMIDIVMFVWMNYE